MSAIIIQSTRVFCPNSPYHNKRLSLLIENGVIRNISEIPIQNPNALILDASRLKLSVGWFDGRVSFKDPGFEHMETLESGMNAACAGGITELAVLPNTKPSLDHKESISYLIQRSQKSPVSIHPIASLSKNNEGKTLAELLDLYHAGALAFSNGQSCLQSAALFCNALHYLQAVNGLIVCQPNDETISKDRSMHEGTISAQLGLKGVPDIAETIMIRRNLDILRYTGGKLHFSCISTADSVNMIRKAKAEGLEVTCDIAAHQLAFIDEDLASYNSFLKVFPPHRMLKDVSALREGLNDDTIDAIVSDHQPQDMDSKKLPFEEASFGMIGLETLFSLVNQYTSLPLEKKLEKISSGPRKVFRLDLPQIAEGEVANLTLFDEDTEWIYEEKNIQSKSKNSPFIGKKMKGKAFAVFNNGYYKILEPELLNNN